MTTVTHSIPNPAVWPIISHDERWTANNLAPHTFTSRISITTQGGMPSLIHVIGMRRAVATVPSVYGESGIRLLVDGVDRLMLSSALSSTQLFENTIERQIMYIPPGATLAIQSYDLSTGGSMFWVVYCQVIYPYP